MKHDTATSIRQALAFRRASLLDIPYLFELILEGSEAGSFTDRFQGGHGLVRLAWMLLTDLLRCALRRPTTWRIVLGPDAHAVGFLKMSPHADPVHGAAFALEYLSIAPAHRNQGIGTAVVERLIAELPERARLVVCCTKYARAMQHILKKETFRRSRAVVAPHLERYTLIKAPTPLPTLHG